MVLWRSKSFDYTWPLSQVAFEDSKAVEALEALSPEEKKKKPHWMLWRTLETLALAPARVRVHLRPFCLLLADIGRGNWLFRGMLLQAWPGWPSHARTRF
mmetsp:Transcript_3942/g.10945  ORF Transcript_3942/g.10945 Transcript_3942/m.10945 type:complete len:100 (+) Transcript_3942:202-501(+)